MGSCPWGAGARAPRPLLLQSRGQGVRGSRSSSCVLPAVGPPDTAGVCRGAARSSPPHRHSPVAAWLKRPGCVMGRALPPSAHPPLPWCSGWPSRGATEPASPVGVCLPTKAPASGRLMTGSLDCAPHAPPVRGDRLALPGAACLRGDSRPGSGVSLGDARGPGPGPLTAEWADRSAEPGRLLAAAPRGRSGSPPRTGGTSSPRPPWRP